MPMYKGEVPQNTPFKTREFSAVFTTVRKVGKNGKTFVKKT